MVSGMSEPGGASSNPPGERRPAPPGSARNPGRARRGRAVRPSARSASRPTAPDASRRPPAVFAPSATPSSPLPLLRNWGDKATELQPGACNSPKFPQKNGYCAHKPKVFGPSDKGGNPRQGPTQLT